MRLVPVVVVGVVLVGCVTGRTPPPSPPRHAELGLAVSTSTLRNGLARRARARSARDRGPGDDALRVGSVDDGNDAGIAHIAEHLMFQQVLGSQTLFAQLEQIATYFNALTTYDATTYITRAPRAYLDRVARDRRRAARLSLHVDQRLGVRARARGRRSTSFGNARAQAAAQRRCTAAVYPEGHPYREHHRRQRRDAQRDHARTGVRVRR